MNFLVKNKYNIILIISAFIFSYIFHLYWINWASGISQFFWHGQLMINNPDGYYFGSGVQKILYGMHMDNPRLLNIYYNGESVITAFITKFFHLSLDEVMLYLPAFISSLIVIPIILIGKLYDNLKLGFLASLIASIGWSYYNRTLAGYYDTDMFNILLPMFMIYFLLLSIKKEKLLYVLIASVIGIVYPWIYGSGRALLYSIIIVYSIYNFIFKKNIFGYKSIILLSVSFLPFNIIIQLLVSVFVFIVLNNKKINILKIKDFLYIAIIIFLIFIGFSNFIMVILKSVFSYTEGTKVADGLHFFNVARTVSEASHIPWNIVFDRIIGSSIGIIIALIGYLLLLKKHKEFIIALPLWGIGFFAFAGGLRFTVYAVPIAAISAVYFFVYISQNLDKTKKYIILSLGSLFILAPNITHIVGCCEKSSTLSSIKKIYPLSSYPYLVPTTFKKTEVKILDELKKKSNYRDYVITWWDYGYPIWYYADVNTLIDGGKHHEDNFIVSKILTTDNPILAYNLSKVSIKKYVDTNKTVALQLFMKNKKPINVSDYLAQLSDKNFKAPKLNRDIYLILPYRMFNILPTVAIFSNRDINTGATYRNHFFYKGKIHKQGKYLFVKNIPIDLSKAIIKLGRNSVPIKEFDFVAYDRKGKLELKKQRIRENGLNVIILKSYGEAIIVDDFYYNSTFIQMFVFQNYNKKLFEPVVLNPFMKIYKLK